MIEEERLESLRRRTAQRPDDHLFSIPVAEVRELLDELDRVKRLLAEETRFRIRPLDF